MEMVWPGRGSDAFVIDEKWAAVARVDEAPMHEGPSLSISAGSYSALLLSGQRLRCLRALAANEECRFALVYLDVPRLSRFTPVDEVNRLPIWLTLVHSHLSASVETLTDDGIVVIHVDDDGAAFVRAMLADFAPHFAHVATVLWEKKYSAPQDLKGRVDDAQDFLFVLQRASDGPTEIQMWQHEFAGKTEDATRETQFVIRQERLHDVEAPKTGKPELLINRLYDVFLPGGGPALEVFTDTGFVAAAALERGEAAVVLVGSSNTELRYATQLQLPRLRAVVERHGRSQGTVLLRAFGESTHPAPPLNFNRAGEKVALVAGPIGESQSADRAGSIRLPTTADSKTDVLGTLHVVGPTHQALAALVPVIRGQSSTVLITFAAAGEPSPTERLREELQAAKALVREQGVVAITCTETGLATARLTAEAVYGRSRYAGTIVVGEPREGNGTQVNFVALFLPNAEERGMKIGLPKSQVFENPDNDPRGPWRDPGHKGARSGNANSAFEYRCPPYRWAIVNGRLPSGVWRLNPFTGVIWARRIEESGEFPLRVKVTDSAGASAETDLTLTVENSGPVNLPDTVWWMDREPASGRALRVSTPTLPKGVVGKPYSVILEASGGQPYQGRKQPGAAAPNGRRTRYWEFARATLVSGILEDDVILGSDGSGTPRLKRRPDKTGRWSVEVELSWWSQDRLSAESAASRLLKLTNPENGLIVASASSLSTLGGLPPGRRIITLVQGEEPEAGTLEDTIARWDSSTRTPMVDYSAHDFERRLAWAEGFLPPQFVDASVSESTRSILTGVSFDGRSACVVFPAGEWPLLSRCEAIAAACADSFQTTYIYYFRGIPPRLTTKAVRFRRIPQELTCI